MINEERTKLMTRLALYESGRGKKELQITKYFPGDYVAVQMLWSAVCGTIAFAIVCVLYALYNMEELMLELFSMDILYFARNILLIYVVFIGIYLGACYVGISCKYSGYKKRVNRYLIRLRELYKYYTRSENQNL